MTIRLSARAVRPAGLREMKRIAGRSSAAHLAARRFLCAARELGEQPRSFPRARIGGHTTQPKTFVSSATRASTTFGSRSPGTITPAQPLTFGIKPEMFAQVDELVEAGLREKLGVIVNIHHFDDFTTDPKAQSARFDAIWAQLAVHYASSPEGLVFELLNEPKDAATTEVMNPIFARAIALIRRTNPNRTIFLRTGKMEQHRRATEDAFARRRRKPDRDRAQLRAVFLHAPGRHLVRAGQKGDGHPLPRTAAETARARTL